MTDTTLDKRLADAQRDDVEHRAHNAGQAAGIYAAKCARLRRENEQLRALLREAQEEIGQQCSIIYNSNVTPDGEVHESDAKAELDRIDGLFRRIDAIPNGEREEP